MTQSITSKMRGRPVTSEEAATSVQRLINSHFHNKDTARCQIPVSAMDDDVVASDYVQESAERIAALEEELNRERENRIRQRGADARREHARDMFGSGPS